MHTLATLTSPSEATPRRDGQGGQAAERGLRPPVTAAAAAASARSGGIYRDEAFAPPPPVCQNSRVRVRVGSAKDRARPSPCAPPAQDMETLQHIARAGCEFNFPQ